MRLIDADELLKEIDKYAHTPIKSAKMKIGERAIIEDCKGIINSLPTVDTERHGHWKSKKYCTYICSNCGFDYFDDILKEHTKAELSNISKYCPVCGVKMDEVTE